MPLSQGRPSLCRPFHLQAFTVVTERLNAERKLFKEKLVAGVAPLHTLLARHMQAFMTCADGWQLHGEFARAAAACMTELTLLLPSREALPGGDAAATALLEGVHTACGSLMQGKPLAGGVCWQVGCGSLGLLLNWWAAAQVAGLHGGTLNAGTPRGPARVHKPYILNSQTVSSSPPPPPSQHHAQTLVAPALWLRGTSSAGSCMSAWQPWSRHTWRRAPCPLVRWCRTSWDSLWAARWWRPTPRRCARCDLSAVSC